MHLHTLLIWAVSSKQKSQNHTCTCISNISFFCARKNAYVLLLHMHMRYACGACVCANMHYVVCVCVCGLCALWIAAGYLASGRISYQFRTQPRTRPCARRFVRFRDVMGLRLRRPGTKRPALAYGADGHVAVTGLPDDSAVGGRCLDGSFLFICHCKQTHTKWALAATVGCDCCRTGTTTCTSNHTPIRVYDVPVMELRPQLSSLRAGGNFGSSESQIDQIKSAKVFDLCRTDTTQHQS